MIPRTAKGNYSFRTLASLYQSWCTPWRFLKSSVEKFVFSFIKYDEISDNDISDDEISIALQ